jgi:nucleotide-binding universal stress UspA family protein
MTKERMTQSSVEMESSDLSGLRACRLLESYRPRGTRNRYPDSSGYFEYGNPDREIDVIARQLRGDLIIVSVHHGKWLEHLLFGRRVDWILANAPCPVLVIGEQKTGSRRTDNLRAFMK